MGSAADRPVSRAPASLELPEQIGHAIEADLEPTIADLPPKKRELIVATVKEVVEHHSGPLPHPQTLAAYDAVVPGLAERIVAMTERELAHHQDLQKRALSAEIGERRVGQASAVIVTLAALGVSGWIATSGYPWVGGGLGGMTLAGIAFAFIGGKEYLLNKISRERAIAQSPPARRKKR